jgi:branched-chain amino acid transport system permease protein
MGLAGALQAHFIGFIAPDNYASSLTFLTWTMLVVGGSGNNKGALLGAVLVWGLWSASGYLAGAALPADLQARGASLQSVGIGVMLALILLLRPRGLLGEHKVVSRHIGPANEA